jgi:hypothetical protein
MRYVFEKMIAIAFALPKVLAVLCTFLTSFRIKVYQEF